MENKNNNALLDKTENTEEKTIMFHIGNGKNKKAENPEPSKISKPDFSNTQIPETYEDIYSTEIGVETEKKYSADNVIAIEEVFENIETPVNSGYTENADDEFYMEKYSDLIAKRQSKKHRKGIMLAISVVIALAAASAICFFLLK